MASITLNPKIHKEIKSLRNEKAKHFDLGNGIKRAVFHCKPIHYTNTKGNLSNISLNYQNKKDKYLINRNKISSGFRKDKQYFKYFGLRYDYNHQFEASIKNIILDDKEQVKGEKAKSVKKIDKNKVEHKINNNVSIVNQINEVGLVNLVKVKNPIEDFKLIEEIHLKGLKCSNKKKGNQYIPDKHNRFNFVNEKNELSFWINQPYFEDNSGQRSQNITHALEKVDGKLIYIKTPTKQGHFDLIISKYPILIDTNTYYSSTSDGYAFLENLDTWVNVRNAGTASSALSATANYDAANSARVYDLKGDNYGVGRSYFYFDTSDLPDGATVTAAVLKIYGYSHADTDICAQKGTQADPFTTADYDAFSGSEYGHVSWAVDQYNSITFNATGKSEVSLTGTTKICCREYTHDYLDSAPATYNDYYNGCYYADEAGDTKDPKLEIDYTTSIHSYGYILSSILLTLLSNLSKNLLYLTTILFNAILNQ